MLEVDLHSHSLYSGCGVHTVLELLEAACKRGIKVLAITDHGTELKSSINSVFYERFINPFKDIKLLKGMECNPIDASGLIDLPSKFLPFMDVVLCGLHHNIKENLGAKKYTDMMIAAIKSNPAIDIITHPDDSSYPMQFERLAKVAKENGVALELNNSKILLKRVEPNRTRELIKACKNVGCQMVINSDAHAVTELGLDDSIRPLLEKENFPSSLLINDTNQKANHFIESRKINKLYKNI